MRTATDQLLDYGYSVERQMQDDDCVIFNRQAPPLPTSSGVVSESSGVVSESSGVVSESSGVVSESSGVFGLIGVRWCARSRRCTRCR